MQNYEITCEADIFEYEAWCNGECHPERAQSFDDLPF